MRLGACLRPSIKVRGAAVGLARVGPRRPAHASVGASLRGWCGSAGKRKSVAVPNVHLLGPEVRCTRVRFNATIARSRYAAGSYSRRKSYRMGTRRARSTTPSTRSSPASPAGPSPSTG